MLWHLGSPDQALTCAEHAVSIAAAVSHAVSRAGALSWAAALHQLRGEVGGTRAVAETDLALFTEEMIAFFRSHAMILRGWALFKEGRSEEGIIQMCEGLVAYRATGADLECSHWLALLADAYRAIGQPERGLRLTGEALDHVAKTGIVYYEAETRAGLWLVHRRVRHRRPERREGATRCAVLSPLRPLGGEGIFRPPAGL